MCSEALEKKLLKGTKWVMYSMIDGTSVVPNQSGENNPNFSSGVLHKWRHGYWGQWIFLATVLLKSVTVWGEESKTVQNNMIKKSGTQRVLEGWEPLFLWFVTEIALRLVWIWSKINQEKTCIKWLQRFCECQISHQKNYVR